MVPGTQWASAESDWISPTSIRTNAGRWLAYFYSSRYSLRGKAPSRGWTIKCAEPEMSVQKGLSLLTVHRGLIPLALIFLAAS